MKKKMLINHTESESMPPVTAYIGRVRDVIHEFAVSVQLFTSTSRSPCNVNINKLNDL